MILRLALALFVSVLFSNCSNKKPTDSSLDSTKVVNAEPNQDTLNILDKVYRLEPLDKKDFLSEPKPKSIEGGEEYIDDATNVKRNSLELAFHLRNGSDSLLVSDTTAGWEHRIMYHYLESFSNLDYWLMKVTYYEGDQYLLLDKENGKKHWIWGQPSFSSDHKYFITNSCDIYAGYNSNGLQLFRVNDKKVILLWQKEIQGWGPWSVLWKNDSTLYIEQQRYSSEERTYRKMIIPKNDLND